MLQIDAQCVHSKIIIDNKRHWCIISTDGGTNDVGSDGIDQRNSNDHSGGI